MKKYFSEVMNLEAPMKWELNFILWNVMALRCLKRACKAVDMSWKGKRVLGMRKRAMEHGVLLLLGICTQTRQQAHSSINCFDVIITNPAASLQHGALTEAYVQWTQTFGIPAYLVWGR